MNSTPEDPIVALAERFNAHVVLCDRAKRPYWQGRHYGWRNRQPSLDVLTAHDGVFGIVPWSIRSTVLDVDFGDPRQLRLFAPPYVELPTTRGWHEYYDDDKPRKNRDWNGPGGTRGQVRGANGYVVLHGDGPARLLEVLEDHRRARYPYPADLFEAAGLVPVFDPGPARPFRMSQPEPPDVEDAPVGQRHHALFTALRRKVDVMERPRRADGAVDVSPWVRRVTDAAFALNARLSVPKVAYEAQWMGYSVATWYASRDAHARTDHSPTRQAARGRRSGATRRQGSITEAAPWLALGISRRTWYRRQR